MFPRGDPQPPLEPIELAGDNPIGLGYRHVKVSRPLSSHSPPLTNVCTPMYKRKIREAFPFVTPATSIPTTPSLWPQMTDRANQQSPPRRQGLVVAPTIESARLAPKVANVHMNPIRRGSGDPEGITHNRNRLFPDDLGFSRVPPPQPPKSLHRLQSSIGVHTPAPVAVTPIPYSYVRSAVAATPHAETPSTTPRSHTDLSDKQLDAKDDYLDSLLKAEAALDCSSLTEADRAALEIPRHLPAFPFSDEQYRDVETVEVVIGEADSRTGVSSEQLMSCAEFATLFLCANGMPLLQTTDEDNAPAISLYTGQSEQLFEKREEEFRRAFDAPAGGEPAFSKAAGWFSRNTLCQRSDTQLSTAFKNHGELPIQTQLLIHMKSGVRRRDAVQNCYSSIENLSQKCDQSKFEEKRRIQNLMRRLAENIVTVFVAQILTTYDHSALAELKVCFEEMDFDANLLTWSITTSVGYSSLVFTAFWDWLSCHMQISETSLTVAKMREVLQRLRLLPSELNETDVLEVLRCMSLATSKLQLAAYQASPPLLIRREDFVRSLSHIPFNHPDFQIKTECIAKPDELDALMVHILHVADLITAATLKGSETASQCDEEELAQLRIQKTYNSPGTATEAQKNLNLRTDHFVAQDYLASYIISFEEIQILLAATDATEQPLILRSGQFQPIKVIEWAIQLMITCVTLPMASPERFALRNPMGPLAIAIDEASVIQRAEKIRVPSPPGWSRSANGDSRKHREALPQRPAANTLRIPEKYDLVVRTKREMDELIDRQRAQALELLVKAPRLQDCDQAALSSSSRQMQDFQVHSEDEPSDDEKDATDSRRAALQDSMSSLKTRSTVNAFVLLHSAECLIETSRILISGMKVFPKVEIPLTAPALSEKDPEMWDRYWGQQAKLTESLVLQATSLRWTSLLQIAKLFRKVRPIYFSDD